MSVGGKKPALRGFSVYCDWGGISQLRSETGLDDPAVRDRQVLGLFDKVQKPALSDQPFKIIRCVTAKLLVVKIHPKPDSCAAVIHVEGTRLRVSRDYEKKEQRFWQLDPFHDRRVIGHMEQPCNRSINRCCYLLRLLLKINDWNYIHLSKHVFLLLWESESY
jgi:hypothetical protein